MRKTPQCPGCGWGMALDSVEVRNEGAMIEARRNRWVCGCGRTGVVTHESVARLPHGPLRALEHEVEKTCAFGRMRAA